MFFKKHLGCVHTAWHHRSRNCIRWAKYQGKEEEVFLADARHSLQHLWSAEEVLFTELSVLIPENARDAFSILRWPEAWC